MCHQPPQKPRKLYQVTLYVTFGPWGPMDVAVLLVPARWPTDAGIMAIVLWAWANAVPFDNISVVGRPRLAYAGDVPIIPKGFVDPLTSKGESLGSFTIPPHLAESLIDPVEEALLPPPKLPPRRIRRAAKNKVSSMPPEVDLFASSSNIPDHQPSDPAAWVDAVLNAPDAARRVLADIHPIVAAQDWNAASLLYLCVTSRLTERPLWAMVTGTTGTGKSELVKRVTGCMSEEDVIHATTKTDAALIELAANAPDNQFDMHGKLLACDERNADAIDPSYLRSLYADRRATKLKATPTGTVTLRLIGCPALVETSTSPNVASVEDGNRRIFIITDESSAKAAQILSLVAAHQAGTGIAADLDAVYLRHQSLQRCLPRRAVIQIPFAHEIIGASDAALGDGSIFRRFEQLCALTKTAALIGYRTRRGDNGAILATEDDYALAYELLKPTLSSTASGVSQRGRIVIEGIAGAIDALPPADIKRKGFTRADVQKWTGLAKTSLERHLDELLSMELLLVAREGGKGVSHVYRLHPAWRDRLSGDFGFVSPDQLKANLAQKNAQAARSKSGQSVGKEARPEGDRA